MTVASRLMRAARLHGVGDLRIEEIDRPTPGPGEVLVAVEVCGVCSTDARKFHVGLNDGQYPLNPGHEWVGRVVDAGDDVQGLQPGDAVFGDTYAGYAEYAVIGAEPTDWSCGAIRLPQDLPAERGVFLEPLADCLHAVRDQARVRAGDRVVVVGAGVMGLQLVASAHLAEARVLTVEPVERRRELASGLGAEVTVPPDDWKSVVMEWSEGAGADAVIVAIGSARVVPEAMTVAASGGRIVAFAGFGQQPFAELDLNLLHYRELSIVGSEWIGTPPHQRRERYAEALSLLGSGRLRLEELVEERCSLDAAPDVLARFGEHRAVKTVLDLRGLEP